MADYLLDCSIAYDGPAPVSTYFPVRCEGGVQRATLRGRDLHGRAFKLPESVTGLVRVRRMLAAGTEFLRATGVPLTQVLEQPRAADDGAQTGTVAPETCLARECIRDITVWGHDCRPAHDHKLQQAIDTIAVLSDALHGGD